MTNVAPRFLNQHDPHPTERPEPFRADTPAGRQCIEGLRRGFALRDARREVDTAFKRIDKLEDAS